MSNLMKFSRTERIMLEVAFRLVAVAALVFGMLYMVSSQT